MTVLNICGFETGDTYELASGAAGTYSIQGTVKRTGDYALRCNPATTAVGWVRLGGHGSSGPLPINLAGSIYYRFYFRVDTLPSSDSEEFAEVEGDGSILFLRITSAGKIQAYATDGTTQLGSDGATTLATDGTWYRIEVYAESANPGAYTVKLNGVTELSGTGNLAGNEHNYLTLGKVNDRNGESVDFYYDDVAIDTAAFPGEGAIKRLAVTGDGTYTAWTIYAGSGSDYQTVDEVPADGADSLASTLTIGEASTVRFATTASAGVSGRIYAVKHGGVFYLETMGATAKLRLRSGGSDYDSTVFYPVLATYIAEIYSTDPATGSAWTPSAIDSIESGGVEATDVLGDRTLMWCMFLMVDYVPVTSHSFGTIIG